MEHDADDLTLIPRSVRDKLDRVGIKLHLREWSLFQPPERVFLCEAACDTPADVEAYRRRLDSLVERYTGHRAERLNPKARGSAPPRSA